jgi:hypothetical protein
VLNNTSNLLKFFIRFFVIGTAVIAAIWWLIIQIGDWSIFPVLVGALPVVILFWAFWPKQTPR